MSTDAVDTNIKDKPATVSSINKPFASSAIIVNPCQRENPVLRYITKVSWHFATEAANIVADYELGRHVCALFLSITFHRLHPHYIYDRLRKLTVMTTDISASTNRPATSNFHSKRLIILLLLVDNRHPEQTIRELTRVSTMLHFTLVLAWTEHEAARYLETFKSFEHKPANAIRARDPENDAQRMVRVLTAVPRVTKSDALGLIGQFGGTLKGIMQASMNEGTLETIPGMGQTKIHELMRAFHEPFF